MTGVPPTCCAPGTRYVDGRCEKPTPPPLRCTGGMVPVGTPPKCECPPGTKLLARYGRCIKETTDPRPRTCPPGYRVLDKPNRYGAYCEIIPVACTGGRVPVGSPPKCECPAGTTPRYGRCIPRREPAPTPTPAKCQPYQIGTPPNCRCPPRLTGAQMRPADRELNGAARQREGLPRATRRGAAVGIRRRDLLSAAAALALTGASAASGVWPGAWPRAACPFPNVTTVTLGSRRATSW